MSSSAFFIEAAANTVRLLSCASAGEWIDPNRTVRATKNPARRGIWALHACSRRNVRANQALVGMMMRQAEAPFRQSRGLTVQRDIARRNNNRLTARVKACSGPSPATIRPLLFGQHARRGDVRGGREPGLSRRDERRGVRGVSP